MNKKLYYFVSDVHLGLDYKDPVSREAKFVRFLNGLPNNTQAIYLLGDIFDFWYEYKHVIPKGYTRTLGALASLVDRGVQVYFFNGNHDIWTYSYLQNEVGVKQLQQPYITEIEGKTFCLGHGDGLGNGDYGYKFLNGIFKSRFLQVLFSSIHPRWALGFGKWWSKHNRLTHQNSTWQWRGEDERIVQFSNQLNENSINKIDYFIYGHFHYPTQMKLKGGGELFILGEWINNCDYLVYDGQTIRRENLL